MVGPKEQFPASYALQSTSKRLRIMLKKEIHVYIFPLEDGHKTETCSGY
jgi:hypothetical protein